MKKIVKSMVLVAAAAMGFTSCLNDVQEEAPMGGDKVVVSFVAGTPDTKTSVDTSDDTAPVFSWNDDETFAVLEQTDALAKATSVDYHKADGKAKIEAEFAANAGKGSYKYVTVYPEAAYVSAESISAATLRLPAEQTMVEGSYDPAADLMVSKVVETVAQPTEAQQMQFTRLVAVAKMTLKNLGAGEKVEKVIFTAEGKDLAGTVTADLAAPHGLTITEGVDNVSVAAESEEVFFTVLPNTLAAGDAYTVTVITDKYLYVKKGTILEGKELVFEAGWVTRFNVDMADVAPSEKWVLVRDASTLKSGDVVTIAAKNYNYVVGKQGANYPSASQTEVIKIGDYLYHPIADSETSVDNRIQYFTLLQRDNDRIAFDFYNGEDYEGDATIGFVFANGTNYSPKLQDWCDKNTLFDVEIVDGAATLCASDIEKTYKWWRYSHSTTASSRKFDCTTSVPTVNYQICIYKLEGAEGDIPVVDANVTVPDSDESVTIAEEGTATPIAIEEVVFNYVGSWTITASDEADWLDVAYNATDNCLTYTADANTGAKRETKVKITASLEGHDALTWTFNVLQKGAPQEISIAEFVKLSKDENSTYKLTGKVVTLATNATSSGYYLADEDGNTAIIVYLDTEDGANVWGHDDIEIKIGDIMTVTTVPMGSKKGGSSSKPSIYKGHYGIKVDGGVAAEYTGGDVIINVTKYSKGSVTVPEMVEGSMEECDYAAFSYSGGESATVSFTSENTTSAAREATVTFTCGMASATVTVQQGINPANKLGYELVTDASTLAVGDEVIIVAKNADKALACPTKTSDTKLPSTEIEKTGNVIYDIEEAGVQPFKLVAGESDDTMAFEFTYKETTYYPCYSSGLKMRTSINAAASWTINIDEEGEASITTISSSKNYLMKFNSAASSFTAYLSTAANATKTENAVCIYRKQTKVSQQ